MALKRVWIPSPNYSQRGGGGVRLIVLHTAEGARTIESLGGFFQGSVQASSHVGADDKSNTIGEYVKRGNKAWTQSAYNTAAVSMELCAFSAWDAAEWQRHPNMLANAAAWIAEEAKAFGIPITKLTAAQAQGSGRGVCQHVDLGRAGGGHHDCGAAFPMDHVLDMARGGGSQPTPPEQEDDDLIASAVSDGGTLHVFWVDKDNQTVKYKYQRNGESKWNDGGIFTKAPKKIAGLSASLTADGTMEVFARYTDASVAHTWQNKGSTSWNGGEPGKQIAEFSALP